MTSLEPFPLTPLQEAYMVGASKLVELGGFRPSYYVELDMVNLDLSRAERALNQLLRRHPHLRTVIEDVGAQRVLSDEQTSPIRLAVTDLTSHDKKHGEAEIRHTRERMCRTGVDPTGWPLFEIVVNRLRPRRVRVHLSMSLLLLDGRGIRQVMDEWRTYYHDPSADLPMPELTYRDCRLELLAHESTPEYQDQWRYWEDRLDHLPEAPQLPLAVQPGAIETVRFTRRTHTLTRRQWQRLCVTFRQQRVLPTTALCHVFAEVLGAWATDPHFSLNLLHQNWATTRPQMEGVVGQFGATLPLEVDLRQSGDFWERARQLQRQVWKDLQNADVAGVRITRELAARRGWMSRGAALPYVFTSMLKASGTAEHHRARRDRDRLACREVTSDLRTPQVLVDNQLHDEASGGVECVWDIVDDAFPVGLPDLMFEAYGRMLDHLAEPSAVTAQPNPVSAQHQALIAELNAPVSAPPAERLEDGFLRQAALRPDAAAVLTAHRVLTYDELEARSRAVACWLGTKGVGRGDVVPLVMTKGWEQIVAVLGVVRAGAAYCPIDADQPAERISHLLDECSARVVLVQSSSPRGIGELGSRLLLCVDRLGPADQTHARVGDPADLAYIIYTSGSTGQPKGVMVQHQAAVNTIADVNDRLELTPDDRVFGISSLSFDLSVWDVFGTLAAGAALVLPEATRGPNPLGWAQAAVMHGATVWNSVPALAQMLGEVVEQRPEIGLPPFRVFLMSGDWIPTELPDRLRRLWPNARVIAMGGATEASIWSNVYEIDQVDPTWRSVPYGVPLRNQSMRVLDHRLALCPPWAIGRIHIGGVGLSQGYWRDARRTDERFIRHPETSERLYVTGDLGCYWPDGTIEFLGREDRQLKVNGFRIEPGEVEAAIREHPAVQECVVSGASTPGGQRRLVGLVVPREGESLHSATVLTHLRSRLPHYLIPGQVHVLARLPLTSNGKVDIAAALATLAAQAPLAAQATTGGQGAGGELVERLCGICAELLELPSVDPDGNFFALGGNSLLALRLINWVRSELGVELQFGQVFEAPTARVLAGRITVHDRLAGCRVALSSGADACDGPSTSSGVERELFLFHPVGGSVSSYAALARSWPGAVHAFQSRALAQGSTALLDVDLVTMATAYREELQATAKGPYVLGGWSMGGVLAYEVGRQLAERGFEVCVFMIDSDLTEVRGTTTEVEGHLEFLGDLAGGRLPGAARLAVLDAASETLTPTAAEISVRHGWLPAGTSVQQYQMLQRVHAHNLAILSSYRAEKSDVPTLLFVAGGVERTDPLLAWRDVSTDLEVEVWPENHYSIVADDRLAAIAHRVTAWLGDRLAQR